MTGFSLRLGVLHLSINTSYYDLQVYERSCVSLSLSLDLSMLCARE